MLDMIFLGDHLRLHTELLGRSPFVVKIPNIVGHGAVLPGDTVQLGWLTTDCRALDVTGPESANGTTQTMQAVPAAGPAETALQRG
ncbi:TOBE domain-containing protein [Candidatus Rariloculus sp.]|uniref:TOBE domain-containing protein n=1 Tax=Candidatus Rariloculus sp. TaxID=3101265 RepID=UPI003D0D6067